MSDVLIQSIGWGLFQFVWQGALIAAGVGLGGLIFRRSASARYIVAAMGLAAMFAAAAGTTGWYVRELTAAVPHVGASAEPLSVLSAGDSRPVEPRPSPRTVTHLGSAPSSMSGMPVALPDAVDTFGNVVFTAWPRDRVERWLPVAVYAWVVGVLALSLNLLRGWFHVTRVRRHGTRPLTDAWRARVTGLADRLGLHRPVLALESALVDVPAVIGSLQPILLLPIGALTGLAPAQLDAVIAHELAHIRRHDYLVNVLQSVVETLLFFHPAVWWVSHRMRVEREHCCDDVAVEICGDRMVYAHALVSLEAIRGVAPALALAATDGSLLARVRRVVGAPASTQQVAAWPFGGVALLLIVTGLLSQNASTAPPQLEKPRVPRDLVDISPGLTRFPLLFGQAVAPGVVSPPAPAAAPATTPPTTLPIGTAAVIRGRITAADSGAPLRGARVVVGTSPDQPARRQYIFTDDNGRYEATDLIPARYTITATKEGFITLAYGETRPLQGGKTLAVVEKTVFADVNLSLIRGGVITGRVLDVSGDPVPRASVQARLVSYVGGRRTLATGITGDTANDLGEFRIFGLRPGSYYISAAKDAGTVATTNYPNAASIDDILYPRTYAPSATRLEEARLLTVEPSKAIGNVDVTLAAVRRVVITGAAVGLDNAAMSQARVLLHQPGVVPPVVGGTTAGPDGTFRISTLPGTYEVRAILPVAAAAAVATVTANGNVSGITLRPVRMAPVTGRVIVDARAAPPLQTASMKLGAISMDPSSSPNWAPAAATVQADLTFTMQALPGAWLIEPTLPPGWALKAVRLRGADVTDTGIVFREGEEVRDVEIELSQRLTQVSGLARNARGELNADCTVLIFARDPDRRNGRARNFAMLRPEESTSRFSVTTLAAGEYYAVAVPYVDVNEAQNPELLERLSRTASPFTLRDGESRSLDLRVAP